MHSSADNGRADRTDNVFLSTDCMRHVRSRAVSSDRTVTATKTAEHGIWVNLEFGCLGGHDAMSLARSVSTAVNGVVEAYRRADDEVMKRHFDGDALAEARRTAAGRKLQPFLEALEQLEVSAIGPREVAKVGTRDGRFWVGVHNAALRLREVELSEEIDAALSAVHERRSMEAARLYNELVADEPAVEA